MSTDTSEKGLELLIVRTLTGLTDEQILTLQLAGIAEIPAGYIGAGYILGRPADYDREHAVDLVKLTDFIRLTQPKPFAAMNLGIEGIQRTKFLNRLQGEIAKRGIVDVLRKGLKHEAFHVELFYGTPSPGNRKAQELWDANILSITRQLCYSKDETQLALDLCLFINGLPIATFELKNSLTKQTVEDAVQQYKRDRDSRELLFQFGRCLVHFAVDDAEVQFCTHLKDKATWFLPFNKGWIDGAGNPPNPEGLKTDYLWKEVLTKEGLTDIIENYAERIEEKDAKTGKVKRSLIFPRYHQRDVVRKLLADARANRPGKKYLIQHSAGSGKSNSIAWLANQLVSVEKDSTRVFDSVIVVTDRVLLDRQIRDTIKRFNQVGSTVVHAENSSQLREYLQNGKRIIITTVQKFPYILEDIGNLHKDSSFAIIIDEAHSSQGGQTAAKMNIALSGNASEEEDDSEDQINRLMESRKMLPNASYFAFTATPKNKTLEVFGEPYSDGDAMKHRPFHSYTMKQAIQEGFILDVLSSYTPVNSYYNLIKTVESDPEFDSKKAQKKLRRFVESNSHAIHEKAEIMVEHFHEFVKHKIDGKARAMIVTGSILRAIEYFHAFNEYLREIKSPYKAIVAFSGEHEYGGRNVTEASLNGFSSNKIADEIQEGLYRFLICADKFQTGYDEPLLHTMYVDKQLSGIKAVQTLSRLNRARPGKYDTFVLDFVNDIDMIQMAFEDYYRTTILARETDPNRLHDLKADIEAARVYEDADVNRFVELYLGGADRDKLDIILDGCVGTYLDSLDEEGQVNFKGNAKAFVRTYGFLASVLPFNDASWERLSIFLNFLIPKLPAPKEEDLSKGILESIDMDSYRVEVRSAQSISLKDEDAEIEPVPTSGSGHLPEPELDHLSSILKSFNDLFGNLDWKDADKIRETIAEEIPAKVSKNKAYQNAMMNSDKQNARIEHDRALQQVIIELLTDHTELCKQFSDNPAFKKWLADITFSSTYNVAR